MRHRVTRPPGAPVRRQVTSVTLGDGRTFGVVPGKQMRMMRQRKLEELAAEAAFNDEPVTEDEMMRRLDAWQKTLSVATLEDVLAQMTPEERRQYETRYRFGGVWRTKKR